KLALAALAHARFEEPTEDGELFGQIPADQWRRLIEGAGLLLTQRQVVQRLEDEVLTFVRAGMPGDDVGTTGDHHRVDIAADQNFAMAVGGRPRSRTSRSPIVSA